MAPATKKKRPAVKGLLWHRNQYYSFFVPKHWQQKDWADGRDGVLFYPDPSDPLTFLAVEMKDLGMKTTAADLDTLAEGFFEVVEQLPDCQIELREQKVTGAIMQLEAKYTFREAEDIRKRWVQVLYHGTRQVAMTAQGVTEEAYHYWLPWFFEAMKTAKVHYEKPTIESLG